MDDYTTSSLSSSQMEEENPTSVYQSQRNLITEHCNSYGIPLKPGGKSSAIVAIRENRKREKRDLSVLNDRFASYVERVRFLEAKNKNLQVEIDQLRDKKTSQPSRIKEMYDIEMRAAQFIIDDTDKDRATTDLRMKHTEEETLKLQDRYASLLVERGSNREKIELLQKQISDNEADVNLFRRRLVDLEDEHQHYHSQSQELILDIQHLTNELDHEALIRQQLENEKQKLEEEIHFLKDIHLQNLEEIKQNNLINTRLEPTDFFKHELSNTVSNIRHDYEQRHYQQRNELESQYQWNAFQTMHQLQSHRTIAHSDHIYEQEEFKKLQMVIEESRHDITTMRQRNDQMENRIRELEKIICTERSDHNRASDEYDRQINDLRTRLVELDRDYEKLNSTKSSLHSEITGYQKLLEGDEKREGLQQTLSNFYGDNLSSDSYPRSYQTGSFNQGWTSQAYAPFSLSSSTTTEPTIFEQVYGGYRQRRPTTFQRIPLVNRSNIYQWNGNHLTSRKLNTMSLFETGSIRDQQSRKAVTPPSSDYTDAYLSAFAPKLIPKKHIYRLTTPLFVNAIPVRTSQTRFNNINNTQILNTFDRIPPSFYDSNSTYSSNLTPAISTKYESLSSAQSSLPETQTLNSTYEKPLYNAHPSVSAIDHSELSFENVSKHIPLSSMHPSTAIGTSTVLSTYKPSVSFQSAPLPALNNIDNNRTSKLKEQSSPEIEMPMKRPETLLFQSDEDINSSYVEKSPSIITPLLESPAKLALELENQSTVASRPIEILENTITKYDSLIGQISDILASVSPLNAATNVISPSKSILDYELSSNGSPILQRKHPEPESLEQPSTPIRNICIQLVHAKHLIRDDSYDKMITAIADLDSEITPPPENRMPPVLEQVQEESNTFTFDEHQLSSIVDDKVKEKDLIPLLNDTSSPNKTKLEGEDNIVDEQSKNEIMVDTNDFIQSQTSNIPSDEAIKHEANISVDQTSSKNDEKHVRWDETVINNDDDESLSYHSLTEESYSSELPKVLTTEKYLTSDTTTSVSHEGMAGEEDTDKPAMIETSDSSEQQVISNVPTTLSLDFSENQEEIIKLRRNLIKGQIKFTTSLETSSSFSDSVEPQSTSSDLIESRASHDEQITSSSNSPIDPLTKDTSVINVQSTISTTGQLTPAELDIVESIKQLIVTDTKNETEALIDENPPLSSFENIKSSFNMSDEQTQLTKISSDIGMETTENVESDAQSIMAPEQLKNDNEIRLETAAFVESTEVITERDTQVEENKQTVYGSKGRESVLENIHDILDIIADKQEILSTSNPEQVNLRPDMDLLNENERIQSSSSNLILEQIRDDATTTTTEPPIHGIISSELHFTINESGEEITLDSDTNIIEQVENQRTDIIKSQSPEISIALSSAEKWKEHTTAKHDEEISTEIIVPSTEAVITRTMKIMNTESEEIGTKPIHQELQDMNMMMVSSIPSIVQDDTANGEEILRTESSTIETRNAIKSEQELDKPTNQFDTMNEEIDNAISSSVTDENQLSLKQNSELEQVNTAETLQDRSSLSQANEQIFTPEKPELYSDHRTENDVETHPAALSSNEFNNEDIIPEITKTTTDQQDLHSIQVLIEDIIQTILSSSLSQLTAISTPDSRLTQLITSLTDDSMQQSSDELESDVISLETEMETISSKPSIELHESSPVNTEPNSFELMHTLRGHSIALPNSPKLVFHPTEKSSSSTTSSQITTSSDRYVSYAIHQMHDSSQDRLPALPIAADIPVYKTIDENFVFPSVVPVNPSTVNDDDSTEGDASDNLTSYSDDVLLRKLHHSTIDRQADLDAISTDDDVDEEFETHDSTGTHAIIDNLTQPSGNLSNNEEGYQLYDLATTPSSNDSSPSSSKQQADDVYIIPGYPGLWRPSADNENSKSPIDQDRHSERKTVIKTRTIVPQFDSVRRPLTFQHSREPTTSLPRAEILTSGVPIRPDTIDIFNRPLNQFSFDMSETDSYQTCLSSVQRQQKQSEFSVISKSDDYTQSSPEESIILIRERERGVSLPITMNIDYDEMAFRLSNSTPSAAHLWSTTQPHVSSSSSSFAHSQPILAVRTNPSSQVTSPSLSNSEHDQQKLSSWLDTVNTVTTTIEGSNGLLESRITFMKSSKGPISISECHPEGHYVIIDNTSRSKNIDLTNWIIRQENDNEDRIIFVFPENCLLKAKQSFKILSRKNESQQKNDDLIATSVSSWNVGPNILTTLSNPQGHDRATLNKKTTICS